LYVSGSVGDARLALECFRGNITLVGDAFEQVRIAMEQPQPRVALGVALRSVATSAIDVSDGLLGDLTHILNRSSVGATIEVDSVPRSSVLSSQPLALQRECTLAGGDDYELLFTAPPSHATDVQAVAREAGVPVTRIGRIDRSRALTLVDAQGRSVAHTFGSFDHFKTT